MSLAAIILVLAAVWAAVTGSFALPNLVLGAAVAAVPVLLLRDRVRPSRRPGRIVRLASLAVIFLRELIRGAISVAIWTLRPDVNARLAPAIVTVPLRVTRDLEITLLANMITLTPGTLSIDVSSDRKWLYVHALDCKDPESLKRNIAEGFEQKIIEAFR